MIQFRIKEKKRGFISSYKAQVKKRFRWKSFYVNNLGQTGRWGIEYKRREYCYEDIELYRRAKGLLESEIEILN